MAKKYKSKINKSKKPSKPNSKWLIGIIGVIAVVVLGVFIVYTSQAEVKYAHLKSFNNTDSSVLKTSPVSETNIQVGRASLKALQLVQDNSKAAQFNTSVKYQFNLPAGSYRLCQKGKVLTENIIMNIGLIAANADVTGGTLEKQVSKSNKNNPVELFCLTFEIPGEHWKNNGNIEYFVGLSKDSENQSGVVLTAFDISVYNDVDLTEGILKNEVNSGEKCSGENIVEGSITDELGNPVPAFIGIDYDGRPNSINTGYEEQVYVNLSKPQGQNTYWCEVIPEGVEKISIEVYSKGVYDKSGQLVNNYLLFGNAQKHNVEIKGKGKQKVNLVLPNSCNSPGVPTNIADTGRVIIKNIKVNDENIDISPKPNRLDNNLWRTNAWSRNLDPGVTIAGFSSLNTRLPRGRTTRADIIGRLASEQKYLVKVQVSRKNHDYKFEIPGVYVEGCGDTEMDIRITDKIYGNYDSQLTCVAKVKSPGRKEDEIKCSSVVEEPNKQREKEKQDVGSE